MKQPSERWAFVREAKRRGELRVHQMLRSGAVEYRGGVVGILLYAFRVLLCNLPIFEVDKICL